MKNEELLLLDKTKKRIILTEEIYYFEANVVSSEKYILSGHFYLNQKEEEKRVLLVVSFDDILLSKEESFQCAFSYSESYGTYRYLTHSKDNEFRFSFTVPNGVKKVKFGIKKWNNKYDVEISSKLSLTNIKDLYKFNDSDMEILFDELNFIKTELHKKSLEDKNILSKKHTTDMDIPKIRQVVNAAEKNNFSQIESFMNIQNVLDIRFPLPKMRGWAISPDFAELLLREILIHKPKNVVEFGSGVSTLIIGYALEKNEQGKLTSFDHDMHYGAKTIQNIHLHGLESYAEVISAPITEMNINDRVCKWYDIDIKKIPDKIDMLIIDGPPAGTGFEARYPALPFLIDYLADDAIVIMDDGIRQDEKDICAHWVEEYPEFKSEYIETEKGVFILKKIKSV